MNVSDLDNPLEGLDGRRHRFVSSPTTDDPR
jgi:hypothetical protein